jgi:hypothetical protein
MPLPPEAHRLQPDHLPTPFSAAQIREACPAGRTIRIREESSDAPPTFRRIRFVEVDADGAVHEVQAIDQDGAPIGEPRRGHSTWLDLQRHASQPADATTVDEVELTLPFGDYDCWRYIVRRPDAELRFWFAQALPGMPAQVEEWVDGVMTGRSTMIANDWGRAVEKDESARESRG